jgi:hypothetical protein
MSMYAFCVVRAAAVLTNSVGKMKDARRKCIDFIREINGAACNTWPMVVVGVHWLQLQEGARW